MLFNVTYDIVTEESAENGETSEDGFIYEAVGLRIAIDGLFETRTSHVGGINFIESGDNWITVGNGMEHVTGAYESRSLHFPDNMTPASINRVVRLINA